MSEGKLFAHRASDPEHMQNNRTIQMRFDVLPPFQRCDRYFHVMSDSILAAGWYIRTRENMDLGPYNDKVDALRHCNVYKIKCIENNKSGR